MLSARFLARLVAARFGRGAGVSTAPGVYLLPALLLTAALFVYPAVDGVWLSLQRTTGTGPSTFLGLANYRALLHDAAFGSALRATITYALISGGGSVVLGTLLALALDGQVPGNRLFRFVILAPAFLPVAYTGLVWQAGFDPLFGWANQALGALDPALSRAWLADPSAVIPVLAIVSVIQYAGYPMAIIWAAMQDIPRDVREAAMLDGAGPVVQAWSIIIPLVREVLLTVTLLQAIFNLKVFDVVWVMTQGGPAGASDTLTTYVYKQAFQDLNFGYGSAIAVVTTLLIAGFTLAYLGVFRPRGIYARG